MFVGHFSIPKVGSCALKQLRFLSCSHGSFVRLRTGNGAGLQTMSSILPSLKSLAEIPSTSYELCVVKGLQQSKMPCLASLAAEPGVLGRGDLMGTPAGLVRLGATSLMDPCSEEAC